MEECSDPGHGFINKLMVEDLVLRAELWARTTYPVQRALYERILGACTGGPTVEEMRKALSTSPSSTFRRGLLSPGFYSSYAVLVHSSSKEIPPLCRWNAERFRLMGVLRNITDFVLMLEDEGSLHLLQLVRETLGKILDCVVLNYVEEEDIHGICTFVTLGLGRSGAGMAAGGFLLLKNFHLTEEVGPRDSALACTRSARAPATLGREGEFWLSALF